jgi:hypothetical protein
MADLRLLGHGRCHRNSQARRGIGRARARRVILVTGDSTRRSWSTRVDGQPRAVGKQRAAGLIPLPEYGPPSSGLGR